MTRCSMRKGNVWYSDFTSQFIGKLDPKTGKVVEYPVPHSRLGPIAQGGLQIDIDKEGRIYYGNMSQMQIVRFDPKTGKMETFKSPVPESEIGDGHLTMIDPAFQQVDGKIWINVADAHRRGGWHLAHRLGDQHLDSRNLSGRQPSRPRLRCCCGLEEQHLRHEHE